MIVEFLKPVPAEHNPAKFWQPGMRCACDRSWGQYWIDEGHAKEVNRQFEEEFKEPEPEKEYPIIVIDEKLIKKLNKKK
jgi:hypothetical protein